MENILVSNEDSFSLLQLIKLHPLCRIHADSIRDELRRSRGDVFHNGEFLAWLKQKFPEISVYLTKNFIQYKNLVAQIKRLRMRGYQFCCYGDEFYPRDFYLMLDPPLTLSFLGSPTWLLGNSLAVVGSREPRAESLSWIEEELGEFVKAHRVHIVSGGARGIDQAAHALALRHHLPTCFVLPSGLGNIYPSHLSDWIKPVLASGGSFLSEYDFEQPMRKHLFHHRNRLIAALGKALLLVEAKRRSGSLISAQAAAQIGRALFVVPGHPFDKNFSGNLDLLANGATLVRDAQDLGLLFGAELEIEEMHHGLGRGLFDGATLALGVITKNEKYEEKNEMI